MKPYIHQLKNWPGFSWDQEKLTSRLAAARHRQGRLMGRMESLGFRLQDEAVLETLTMDVLKSSEIEGEILARAEVRSSIARKLGMNIGGLIPSSRNVDGVVEMMMDATQNFSSALTQKKLFTWHAALFPGQQSGLEKITTGKWRNDKKGPMQVISGPLGRERVHYEAPAAKRLPREMKIFLEWFNKPLPLDPVLKAGIAHLWFVTIHPFEDGNGRIARAIADMQLARADGSARRFYSMSNQIQQERKDYYAKLEETQKGSLDITDWLEWFLACWERAIASTEKTLSAVLAKARFWEAHAATSFNERQRLMLNKLLDGFEGKFTSSKWAKMAKCSQDTALRDIQDLINQDVLRKDAGGGRSTGYKLLYPNP
ncbi:MAG: Fic family protein [Dongiaceae bacterium]